MRDSRYVNVNVTAVCDEPADLTAEQVIAARDTVVSWVAKQDGLGAAEAAELFQMLGVHPMQDVAQDSATTLPKIV